MHLTQTAWWILAGASAALALALTSCADSLHLDPPTSTSSTGGSSSTAGGGGGGQGGHGGSPAKGCHANEDCTYPTAICDPVEGKCLQCLFDADCQEQEQGTVCSKGSCGCPTTTDAFCPALTSTMTPPRCVALATTPTDCGTCGHGCFGNCAAGKCVDPWQPTTLESAPTPRSGHVAVWTGSKMVVWGGADLNGPTGTGGIYDPVANAWTPTSMANAPSARTGATAVWTGTAMIVWGGDASGTGVAPLGDGALFNPTTNTWVTMAGADGSAPSARYEHTAVWASNSTPPTMLVWGGFDGMTHLSTGYAYDPAQNSWGSAFNTNGGPTQRGDHTAVWDDTAKQMIIYGGIGSPNANGMPEDTLLGDAFAYNPTMMTWAALAGGTLPAPRVGHAMVFDHAAQTTFVWGGLGDTGGAMPAPMYFSDGASSSDAMATMNAWSTLNNPPPPARAYHTALFIPKAAGGGGLLVWGGENGSEHLGDGYVYDLAVGQWGPTMLNELAPLPTGPIGRSHHTAVLTTAVPTTMIIWGGNIDGPTPLTNTGAIFAPTAFL